MSKSDQQKLAAFHCPFCGTDPVELSSADMHRCGNAKCPAGQRWTTLSVWNKRSGPLLRDESLINSAWNALAMEDEAKILEKSAAALKAMAFRLHRSLDPPVINGKEGD
jgi:hypothetical protein